MTNDNQTIGRRPFLKGAGVTLAALGGLASPVAASHGGPTPLTDRAADILVYWSQVRDDENDPDQPADFGFPQGSDPTPPGGLTFGAHDQAGGGLFDFGRIVMGPDHNLTNNAWVILGGALVKPPFESYSLNHLGNGLYQSVDQEMEFRARGPGQIKKALGIKGSLPPAFNKLGGTKWYAVGNEYAKLDLNGKHPDPSVPLWGATRIDFYHQESMKYGLSLLYVIGADDDPGTQDPGDAFKSLPQQEALRYAGGLITGGRLNPSGQ